MSGLRSRLKKLLIDIFNYLPPIFNMYLKINDNTSLVVPTFNPPPLEGHVCFTHPHNNILVYFFLAIRIIGLTYLRFKSLIGKGI